MKKIVLALAVVFIAQIAKAQDVKEWTVLVFMNAHGKAGSGSDLTVFAERNLRQMKSVGSNSDVNIVAEVGTNDGPGVQRVFVNKGNIDVVQSLDNVNMGSATELYNFIEWAVKNYPAKHYFIDVWNHGMGWHSFSKGEDPNGAWKPGRNVNGEFHAQDISFDFNTQNYISTEQMGDVMRAFAKLIGHKVDIYGNDACEMAMAEVAAEVQDSVQYFIASEEVEAGAGWPYDTFLKDWFSQPGADAAQISKILVQDFSQYYENHPDSSGTGSTLSALDLNYFGDFAQAISNFKNELIDAASSQKSMLMMAIGATDIYESAPDYKDVGGLLSNVQKMNISINKSVATNLTQALQNLVISNETTGGHSGRSHGISIWLPTPADNSSGSGEDSIYPIPAVHFFSENIDRYKGLTFDKQTQWSDFLSIINN